MLGGEIWHGHVVSRLRRVEPTFTIALLRNADQVLV
jgi:hypothetical protein